MRCLHSRIPGDLGSSSSGSVSAGQFFINVEGAAHAGSWLSNEGFGSNFAQIGGEASDDATILTDGAVRDGYVSIVFTGSAQADNASGLAQINISFGPFFDYFSSRTGCAIYSCNGTPILFPVTLGVPLDLQLAGSAGSDPLIGDQFAGDASASLSFTFFELDGTTPVGWSDVTSAPEPNAAWLSVIGIALLATRIRRKTGNQRVR